MVSWHGLALQCGMHCPIQTNSHAVTLGVVESLMCSPPPPTLFIPDSLIKLRGKIFLPNLVAMMHSPVPEFF